MFAASALWGLAIVACPQSAALAQDPSAPADAAPQTPGTVTEPPAGEEPVPADGLTESLTDPETQPQTGDQRKPVILPPAQEGGRPRRFLPPPEVPEEMKIEKPLMTLEEYQQYRGNRIRPNLDALKSPGLTQEQEKLIADLARIQVYALTIPEYRKVSTSPRRTVADLRSAITRILRMGTSPNAPNARELYLREVVARTKELLDGHIAVRINAVVLLSQLNEVEASRTNNTPERPYMPAMDVIISVLQDDAQPNAVKLVAASKLRRFFEQGNPSSVQKVSAAEAMVAELDRKKIEPSYQYVLTQSLGSTRVVWDQQRQSPIVPQKLAEVLVDKSREWVVRCGAANAIGRLPLDRSLNVDLIAYEIVKLGHDMAQAYNKRPGDYYWKECFWHLHLAFKRKEPDGADGGLTVGSSNTKPVQDGYRFVVALNNHVLPNRNNAPIATATIDQMAEWLKSNQPANNRLTPTQPPIVDAGAVAENAVRAAATGR